MASLHSLGMININDLPPELVLQNQIFKRLSLADLFKAKLVCKLWNYLISNTRIERLFADADLFISEHWYASHRPCREICHPDLFIRQCKKPILLHLKYFKVNFLTLKRFDPNRLNAFRQLVQLEIDCYLTGRLKLALPNLVVLSLDFDNEECRIKLNLPKLRVLQYYEPKNRDLLRIEHPETVKVLESRMARAKLARFKTSMLSY